MPKKSFTEHVRDTEVALESDLVSSPEQIDELSIKLARRYIHRAKKDVKKREEGEYSNRDDDKNFKRKMYINYAKNEKLKDKDVKEEVLDEEKIRHPEHKKAYVEPYRALDNQPAYKASNRHGKVKYFNERGKASAYRHAGIDLKENVENLHELSANTLTNYVIKASKSRRRIEGEKGSSKAKAQRHFDSSVSAFYAGRDDLATHHRDLRSSHLKDWNRHRKKSNRREQGITRAADKIADKAMPVGTHEETQIDERQDLSPAFMITVNRRATKGPAVLHRKNNKMKGMFRKNKTQYVTSQNFKTRSQHDALHLTSRSKHQLTDRWRDQRLIRIKSLKKAKNVNEDAQYLKNRQALHQAHAQAGREIGKGERDPELRRLHMHRAKKHAHAAKVLDILRKRKPKK